MKETGIVRRITSSGDVDVPEIIRKKFNIGIWDHVEFFLEDDKIILKKYSQKEENQEQVRKLFERIINIWREDGRSEDFLLAAAETFATLTKKG